MSPRIAHQELFSQFRGLFSFNAGVQLAFGRGMDGGLISGQVLYWKNCRNLLRP